MKLKLNSSGVMFRQFKGWLQADPTVELLPTTSEWEVLRYRREQTDEQGRGLGVHTYSIIYRDKKERNTLTGDALTDWEIFCDTATINQAQTNDF